MAPFSSKHLKYLNIFFESVKVRRATEKLLSEADPSLSLPKEGVRFLGKGKIEIKMVIDEQCY